MKGQNNERKFSNMKNRNNQLTVVLFAVAFALAPIVQAARPLKVVPPVRPLTRRHGLMVARSKRR